MKATYNIIITLLLLLFTVSLTAQERKDRRLNTDMRFGINFSEFEMEYDDDFKKPRIGMNIGMYLSYKVYRDFQVQTGFIVTKKGSLQEEYSITVDPITTQTSITDKKTSVEANYVQIPFNIGWEHFFTNDLALNINAGPWLAYGYKGKRYVDGSISYPTGGEATKEFDSTRLYTFNKGGYTRWDYGYGVSVGLIYDIYGITAGADFGQNNIMEDKTANNVKTKNYYFSVGFRF